jgi:Alginate lyase
MRNLADSHADLDVLTIKIYKKNLYVSGNGFPLMSAATIFESKYVLGTEFKLKIVAKNGVTSVYYNSALKYTFKYTGINNYFKIGSYVQTDVTMDAPDAFADVRVKSVKVSHSS